MIAHKLLRDYPDTSRCLEAATQVATNMCRYSIAGGVITSYQMTDKSVLLHTKDRVRACSGYTRLTGDTELRGRRV